MRNLIDARTIRCVACSLVVGLGARELRAQNAPGKPLIEQAAQQINSFAPPAMPLQTIRIGSYDGGQRTFTSGLDQACPTGTPAGRCSLSGGSIPAQLVAPIASYNVTYEVALSSPPPDVRLSLLVAEASGQQTELPAQISGTTARFSLRVQSARAQSLRIHAFGRDTVVMIAPRLKEQLGAFVVPHLLVAIVYEPPGAGSSSDYSQTKTVNTTLSWSTARSTGLVDEVNPEALTDLFNQAVAGGLDALAPGVGKVWQVVVDLREKAVVTKTTSLSVSADSARGFSFSVSLGFSTGAHKYPGGGDKFVVLEDVLFVYLVHDGRVSLAPMAYSVPNYLSVNEVKASLPKAFADRVLALDLHLASGSRVGAPMRPASMIASRGAGPRVEPFAQLPMLPCKTDGESFAQLSQGDFASSSTTSTLSETDVTHLSGLMATISGGGDQMWGVSYSTSRKQFTEETQSTKVTLNCAPDQQFWVELYIDNLFRTLYTQQGEPITQAAAFTGTAQQPSGKPIAGQYVKLSTAGKTYVVQTTANGEFSIPAALPSGPATVVVGGTTYHLALTSAARSVVLKGGVVSERPPAGAPRGIEKPATTKPPTTTEVP